MDLNNITQSLIESIQKNEQAKLDALNQGQQLYNQQIQNANNAAGTLYSTKPAFQMAQQVATDYLPSFAKIQQQGVSDIYSAQSSLEQALKNIKALNDAANRLNSL